jgi:hypothetical protein
VALACGSRKEVLTGSAKTEGPVTIIGGSSYPVIVNDKAVRWAVDVSGSGRVTLYVVCAYVPEE